MPVLGRFVAFGALSAALSHVVASLPTGHPTKPNLVWFLTDDQDQLLGASFPLTSGATPMPKTKRLMQDQGMYANNWYFHNIKVTGGQQWGMHVNYTEVNANTFGRLLKEGAGYTTGMFGKYVNEMPKTVPPGWDAWLANGGGDYIAPSFQTQNIDGLPDGQVHFSNAPENYSTAVIGNVSIAWIKKVAKEGKPFLAYIAPKAAHEPFNPAVWYKDHWDSSWPDREPITENWNCSSAARKHHHGNIATEPMITEAASKVITGVFKNRWRTLMSVDDVIGEVIETVSQLGLLNSTYFFYSSDHGFQLGQFNIPMDKRHVYEWDTKIHLLAKGPGIVHGSHFDQPGTQVDIAPTLLGLAGLEAPSTMDGRSIAPFLLKGPGALESSKRHLQSMGSLQSYSAKWRKEVFIEYYYVDYNAKCVVDCPKGDYPNSDSDCADLENNDLCWCTAPDTGPSTNPNCFVTETPANNFIALRQPGIGGVNTLYAEFQTGNLLHAGVNFSKIDYIEYYDMVSDPWQMHNLASTAPRKDLQSLHDRVQKWATCAGASCSPSTWSLPGHDDVSASIVV